MSAADAAEGFSLLDEARPAYEEAHRYYSGEVGEVFASARLQRRLKNTSGRFRVNVIRSVVASVANRLELASITVEGGRTREAQAMLERIVEANGLDVEAKNVTARASEFGDALLLVWYPDEEGGVPVVNLLDPRRARLIYDVDNPRRKRYGVHAWSGKDEAGNEYVRVNLWYVDRIERWVTKVGQRATDDPADWQESLAEADDPDSWWEKNDTGVIPFFHFRNGTPYGEPEHLHGYGAQDAITKIVASHMGTVDYHLAPQRYALTEDDNEDSDDFGLDRDEFDPDEGDEVKDDGVRSGPGEMMMFKRVKSVGQFTPADSSTFIDPAGFYIRMMGQTTDTPLHIVDESRDEPSGEARRRKEAPLTEKVKDRQRFYAPVWEDALTFALRLAGFNDVKVTARYAPAEVVGDAEGWATVKAKMEAGVPMRIALMEAGYSKEQVDEWWPEDEGGEMRTADLAVVAKVLAELSTAVSLGLVTAEEARAMLPDGVLPEGMELPPAPTPPTPELEDEEGDPLPFGEDDG